MAFILVDCRLLSDQCVGWAQQWAVDIILKVFLRCVILFLRVHPFHSTDTWWSCAVLQPLLKNNWGMTRVLSKALRNM